MKSIIPAPYTESIEPHTGVGVYGWETHEEEDVWDVELDFASFEPESRASETDMTIGELMAWKYLQAEREKELVSKLIFNFCFLLETKPPLGQRLVSDGRLRLGHPALSASSRDRTRASSLPAQPRGSIYQIKRVSPPAIRNGHRYLDTGSTGQLDVGRTSLQCCSPPTQE